MARKLVTDMTQKRFDAWRELLSTDRALFHQIGIVAVRPEGAAFWPGVSRTTLPAARDPDYQVMQEYPDGLAFDYQYEAGVRPVVDAQAAIAPGYCACLMVFDDDVSLSSLRPRVDALIAARESQPAKAPAVPPEMPAEIQSGAA